MSYILSFGLNTNCMRHETCPSQFKCYQVLIKELITFKLSSHKYILFKPNKQQIFTLGFRIWNTNINLEQQLPEPRLKLLPNTRTSFPSSVLTWLGFFQCAFVTIGELRLLAISSSL